MDSITINSKREIGAEDQPATLHEQMRSNARMASRFLKAVSHENRLLILCLLAEGEKAVTELERTLGMRQPAVSQQLARLRSDNLVRARRDGKAIYYSIASEEARQLLTLLHSLYCGKSES
ncbi:metalloregulator ArsR/SmtB family transcription factor [Limibacillus sp. MBR-115]|jgi:DNA-binding transcriptional ArsR family regulator|uniref:ArsR/SmtB family transcription factor n=1 Tax=Limibacillus sp. MBR-115 TaxID=3156465 RepID=UPI003395CA69